MFNGKIHYQWWFSIAMLNYQRVAHMFIVAHTNAHSIARHNLLSANISPSASQVQLQDGSQTRALRNKARATAATNLHLPSDSPIYPSSIQESNLSILHLKPGKYLNCIWINGHPGWKNATVHPNDKQSVGVSIVWWMSSLVGLNNCWRSDSGREKMLWIGAFVGQHMDSYGSFLFFPIWMRCRSNAGYPGELFSIWLPLPLCAPWNADKFS